MIVRIMSEGQYEVDESTMTALNELDDKLQKAVDSGNDPAFRDVLQELLEKVRTAGARVPDDELKPSDVILPPVDAHVEEVTALMKDDGLIPDPL